MKQIGIYGRALPEPWGDGMVSASCYATVTEGLARGWMSLAGAMGGHAVVVKLLLDSELANSRTAICRRWLPRATEPRSRNRRSIVGRHPRIASAAGDELAQEIQRAIQNATDS
jgi:hypothetical protein